MAMLTLEQHNGPTLTDPSWSAVEAALRSVHPRDRGYFTLSGDATGYVQAAGARLRMICEWRRLAVDGSFRHVVLGHPVPPDKLTSITTAAGVIQLRANEVLTLDDVLNVFKRFYERGEVPEGFALRDVTATFGGSAFWRFGGDITTG
jgi:hypothetical protein